MVVNEVNFDIMIQRMLIRESIRPVGEEMVKHPRYQAQDVGRMEEIPRVFERYCPESFKLERIEPARDPHMVGPVPRPTFRVLNEGKLVGYFHPYGQSECHDDSFKDIYNKMARSIKKAGVSAMKAFEKENGDR